MVDRFIVESLEGSLWDQVMVFEEQDRAFDYAKFLERRKKPARVRVVVETQRVGHSRRRITYLGTERQEAPTSATDVEASSSRYCQAAAGQHWLFRDLTYALGIIARTAVALAIGAALIAGLQMVQ